MHSVVVVGAGQSGGWVARTLRDQNFAGRIVLVGDEAHPPYERPPLSKDVILGTRSPSSTYLWDTEMLASLHIDLRVNTRAVSIGREAKTVALSTGETLYYDRLVLTTGCRVRRLDIEGAALEGIHYLRSIDDAVKISDALSGARRAVIVGGGWIGLELAAAARQRGVEVTLVETQPQLCARAIPSGLAFFLQKQHEKRGVDFRLGAHVAKFRGDDRLAGLELNNGEVVAADLAIIGIGVVPNSELASAAGLLTDNGILVDASGQTSDPSIYAAGDVANQPGMLTARIRLESWTNAQNQAIAAAKSLLGKASIHREVPYFWSDQYDFRLQILGAFSDFERFVVRGERGSAHTSFYLKDSRVVAAASINSPQDIGPARRLIQRAIAVDPDRLATSTDLNDLLRTVSPAA